MKKTASVIFIPEASGKKGGVEVFRCYWVFSPHFHLIFQTKQPQDIDLQLIKPISLPHFDKLGNEVGLCLLYLIDIEVVLFEKKLGENEVLHFIVM